MSGANDGWDTTPSASETTDPGIDATVGIQHIGGQAAQRADQFEQVKELGIFRKLERLGFQTDALGLGP
jgi:hypothetical protein